MNDDLFTLWEEPLYRFILQITIAEIIFLALIILGVIAARQMRLIREKRRARIASAIFDPLMRYLAGDMSIDEIHQTLHKYPKTVVCLELERYVTMLDGRTLSRIRALYEQLNLRNYGIKLAYSRVWWRRLEGARLLGATSGEAVAEVLMELVTDDNPVVRLAAVRSLGRIRHTRAIRPLLDMLSKAEQMSRRQLAQTLIAFGSDVQPYLKEILREEMDAHGDPSFLATILEVLALTGDASSEPEVQLAIASTQLEVRIAAYKAAALLHLPLEPTVLVSGLEDDAWQVRAQAAVAAGKLKETRVIEELGACLSDRSWWVRSNAGNALFSCGKPGVEMLEEIVATSGDPFARDMALRTLTSDPLYEVVEQRQSLPMGSPLGEEPV